MNYNRDKLKIAIAPALIFWAVSVVFFIMGLSFDDQSGWMFWVALALAIANTIVQLIGNDLEEEMDWVLRTGWVMSYILGVGSNVYALSIILNISNGWIEWPVCLSLGSMIEILPEKLFILFLRSINPNLTMRSTRSRQQLQHKPAEKSVMEKIKDGYGAYRVAQQPAKVEEPAPVRTYKPAPRPIMAPRKEPTYHPIAMFSGDLLDKTEEED